MCTCIAGIIRITLASRTDIWHRNHTGYGSCMGSNITSRRSSCSSISSGVFRRYPSLARYDRRCDVQNVTVRLYVAQLSPHDGAPAACQIDVAAGSRVRSSVPFCRFDTLLLLLMAPGGQLVLVAFAAGDFDCSLACFVFLSRVAAAAAAAAAILHASLCQRWTHWRRCGYGDDDGPGSVM